MNHEGIYFVSLIYISVSLVGKRTPEEEAALEKSRQDADRAHEEYMESQRRAEIEREKQQRESEAAKRLAKKKQEEEACAKERQRLEEREKKNCGMCIFLVFAKIKPETYLWLFQSDHAFDEMKNHCVAGNDTQTQNYLIFAQFA